MCVVSRETCPSQARMVLMSTPERSRCTAVVCRRVWVLIGLADRLGTFRLASWAERLTRARIPNRVMGCLRRFRKTGDWGSRPLMRGANLLAVCGHKGQRRTLPTLPLRATEGGVPRSRSPMVSCAASDALAPSNTEKTRGRDLEGLVGLGDWRH